MIIQQHTHAHIDIHMHLSCRLSFGKQEEHHPESDKTTNTSRTKRNYPFMNEKTDNKHEIIDENAIYNNNNNKTRRSAEW